MACLNVYKNGKKPNRFLTDGAIACSTQAIQKLLKDENTEHHRTSAHPNSSETGIRSCKDMLY